MALTMLLAGGLLGGYEALSVVELEHEASGRVNAQADVKTLIASGVDGAACDDLTEADNGPSMAGALRPGPQVTPLSTPGKDIASYEVTPGLLSFLAQPSNDTLANQPAKNDKPVAKAKDTNTAVATSETGAAPAPPVSRIIDSSGIWASQDLARDFGLRRGGALETDRGTVKVAGVFAWPNDGRDTRPAYALIVPVSSSGDFKECWAKQWPVTPQTDDLLYSTARVGAASDKGDSGITALNKGIDTHYDASATYQARLTRWAPLLGLAFGATIGIASVRRRKLEYAGALHIGQNKHDQMLTITLETAVWATTGTIAAIGIIAAISRLSPVDSSAVLLTAARTPCTVFAGAMLGSLAADVFIRQSQLFRYFKNR